MAYNTPEQAQSLIGVTLSADLLAVARAWIDRWTSYRWESTALTERLSGRGDGKDQKIYIRFPVISLDTFTVDDGDGTATAQVEETDYYIDKPIGEIYRPGGFPWGRENIVLSYHYGFQSGDLVYEQLPIVRFAEAQIALHLKKNPGMLAEINLSQSMSMNFDGAIARILATIPQPITFKAV